MFGSRPSQGRKPLGTELGRVSEEGERNTKEETATRYTHTHTHTHTHTRTHTRTPKTSS